MYKQISKDCALKFQKEYMQEVCYIHRTAFKKLPKNIVAIYKSIFEIDYSIYILRQRILAIKHYTPWGAFVMELSKSDGLKAAGITIANPQNRSLFDYLSTDKDFLPMCILLAKCTEISATQRRNEKLQEIAELREKRQDHIDHLKNLDPELINKFESQFERGKISKIIAVARKEQLMNRLLFCQYCSEIFINPTQQQKHVQYKKYNEFDKDIKLYVAEAQKGAVDSESDDIIDLDEILDNATLQTSSQIPSDVDYDTPTTSRYQGKGKRLSSNPKKSLPYQFPKTRTRQEKACRREQWTAKVMIINYFRVTRTEVKYFDVKLTNNQFHTSLKLAISS
ncbi:uncharacterized protein LOC124200358 [Daphnia pulex]|uniref:uncharacterized protein LOC124200358 n=1 Tax=Daphnia pulex TaxID=6669 RepID=UPI001EDF2A73|nr:uncharacterized protein LOC124200358 [Daphnia pulex]